MFYQLNWQQMEKNWKVICTASFELIVTRYSQFCCLISASSSLRTHAEEKKVAAAAFTVCFLGIQYGGVEEVQQKPPLFHYFNANT